MNVSERLTWHASRSFRIRQFRVWTLSISPKSWSILGDSEFHTIPLRPKIARLKCNNAPSISHHPFFTIFVDQEWVWQNFIENFSSFHDAHFEHSLSFNLHTNIYICIFLWKRRVFILKNVIHSRAKNRRLFKFVIEASVIEQRVQLMSKKLKGRMSLFAVLENISLLFWVLFINGKTSIVNDYCYDG